MTSPERSEAQPSLLLGRVRSRVATYEAAHEHRAVDLVASGVGFAGLWVFGVAAASGVPGWELRSFQAINDLPGWLYPFLWPFMQYGVFITIPVVALIALRYEQRRLAVLLLLGGVGIYLAARYVKGVVGRGRPGDILPSIVSREEFAPGSLGFTSGHTAVAATIATFAHRYLSRTWKTLSIVTLLVVFVGRIYVGGHLPLDVLGGAALGLGVASLVNFVVGVPAEGGS